MCLYPKQKAQAVEAVFFTVGSEIITVVVSKYEHPRKAVVKNVKVARKYRFEPFFLILVIKGTATLPFIMDEFRKRFWIVVNGNEAD